MKPIIVALDVENQQEANELLTKLDGVNEVFVKVGMELFYGEGPKMIRDLQARGLKIFLDLKLHDIPNTVQRAAFQLAKLGVQLISVHALGGAKMMAAARLGLENGARVAGMERPKLLAITELTSISADALKNEQNVVLSMTEQVRKLALLAQESGADGVVCSPQELRDLRQHVRDNFLLVTPGIRPHGVAKGDQVRTFTPREAAQAGSSAIVVGRPISQAEDPKQAYLNIQKEWDI